VNTRSRYSLIAAAAAGVAVAGAIAVWLGRSAEEQPRESRGSAIERERFQDELREFFARAPTLSPEERASRARDIAQEITRHEAAGAVTAAEALTLRTELIRATVEDPVEQVVAIRGLQELYQQRLGD
jgi:hypothetical protein